MAISTPTSVGTGTASGVNTGPSATSSQAVSVGDLLVVAFGSTAAETPTNTTDTLGNTYTQAQIANGTPTVATYYSVVTVAGTPTVKVNCASANRNRTIQLGYMTGSKSTPLDANGTNDQGPTLNETVSTTGAVTQAGNNAAVQTINQASTGTATSTASYTLLGGAPVVSGSCSTWFFYKMNVSAATQTATATMSVSAGVESNLTVYLGAAVVALPRLNMAPYIPA